MQLFDRGILKTPGELAKVADLPDQDDLISGIDPDSARAQRENYFLAIGTPRTVDVIDDHQNHLKLHRDFMRSARYEYLDMQTQQLLRDHAAAHELYAAQQAAQQVQAMGVSPLATMLPTEGTKVLPTEDLAGAQAMGGMVPQSAMSPAMPASPGQAMGQPGGMPPGMESEINSIAGGEPGINPPAELPPEEMGGGMPPPEMEGY
jgi:hypothetical protein